MFETNALIKSQSKSLCTEIHLNLFQFREERSEHGTREKHVIMPKIRNMVIRNSVSNIYAIYRDLPSQWARIFTQRVLYCAFFALVLGS